MAIQIGKYKRPAIFLEEFDSSITTSPIVEGLNNLVIGVSKKGPVNTPIRLTNVSDLESIFGQLDRNLERKGSFFHRTVSKILETTPVYAINLLATDDNLDKIEYFSISSSAGYKNDVKREGAYRKFFDTTGFWKKDTEAFINITKSNTGYLERAFNLTNMSDKSISVFVVKSQLTGFDRTILEWYGSVDKMPQYLNQTDFASDYLVDVIVISGDWSNYQELAVDPRWSAYFNTSGLRKEQIRNFANDRNVSTLAYYEGLSLIPYFRDLNGRNIFIETTINRDTQKTGLYCAFNNDIVEQEFYNGKLDLIGNTIVGVNETSIDFMSYNETISESIEMVSNPLDLPGNVTSIIGGSFSYINQDLHAYGTPALSGIIQNGDMRTGWFSEGAVYNVELATAGLTGTSASLTVTYNVSPDAFAVIGDNYVTISGTTSLVLNSNEYPISTSTASYTAVAVLGSTGDIVLNKTLSSGTNPSVLSSDIVLGYIDVSVTPSGLFNMSSISLTNVTINNTGFIDLTFGSASQYYISQVDSDSIKIEFPGTNTQQSTTNYEQYRQFKMFNRLVNLIDSPNKDKIALNLGPNFGYEKYSLSNVTISNIVTSTTLNKSFVLNGLPSSKLADILTGYLSFYTVDDEFILGTDSVISKNEVATTAEGVVGQYANLYTKYYDGIVNSGDFMYSNRLYVDSSDSTNSLLGKTVGITFIDGETNTGVTSSYAGYDYIVFESSIGATAAANALDFQTFEQIIVPSSVINNSAFTIVGNSVSPLQTPAQLAASLGFVGNFFAYQVNEEVVYEALFNVDRVNNYLDKHYLKMYIDDNNNMVTEFVDSTLESSSPINIESNNTFYIESEKSNLKQSIEIEIPTGYTQVPNKILIKADRYTELKVGDFLEAYVDTNTLEAGEVAKKLTRILSKRAYSLDTSLVEITCDSRIKKYTFGSDIQTMRYLSVDNYASTYKAITLKGFRIRQASLPDGTEVKQNEILNLVSKGTPLFKALTNKDAIDYRYLVDSFGLGLTERSKQQLVDICGERLDVFGFINMPSIRQFKNSSSPSFTKDGVLQVEFISKGGDPESNPAFLYSFGDGAGASCVGYFTPWVTVNDNGRPLEFPPASYVATTYMRKHISNITAVTPWTIAAGVNNGRITNISGLEIDFTPTDIEFLNQSQMNPIVFKKNRGYVIETENTGQTLYKSALSLIHVREVLIELESELALMLEEYKWRFNTPDVRAEIKLRADVICETYVSKNGLYNYFNKMDDENNTSELIDNQIGVLDTYVEPVKGLGIIVNNITILRTGAISSGGFING